MKDKILELFKDKKNVIIVVLSGLFLVSCVSGLAQNKTNELAYSKMSSLEKDLEVAESKAKYYIKEYEDIKETWKKQIDRRDSEIKELKKEIESYKQGTEQPKDEKVVSQTPTTQVQATEPARTQAPATQQTVQQTVQQTQPITAAPRQVYYKNCKEAKAAGVTPIHRGEPGYAPHLDRDGDGVACE
ncbi:MULTISPECIES: excalibur calcium-binding domain-containing protein [unclassified Granulicatella]|uniref:excalibur calcium-binding domain-containing protein n=1 Tax=unclassified Granulicatella TaxID=2630493 RepID=UPI00107398AD|nr:MULTISPECIES: excalibur calcium-binding domain-containing protein [unclassified Granulicatella]MBF0779771.1 excalibur calcium-binding domain-containing protein [Granulicatella sp. 19428wC4_WM01]TFU96173.1 hypothetical protein E4T68_01565 [Granulicatella sp. WM01]